MNRADRNRQMLEFFAQRAAGYDAVHLPMMDNKRAITPVSYTHLDVYKRQ